MRRTFLTSLRRHLPFTAAGLLSVVLFLAALRQWVRLSLEDNRYSHLILVPVLAAGFFFVGRRTVFARRAFSPRLGFAMLAGAALLRLAPWPADLALTLAMLGFALALAGAFALCYGPAALNAARFPFLFLILMAPVPSAPMDRVIGVLQHGAAYWTEKLFLALGVPMFRRGTVFELPMVWMDIAPECSAIHSGWALFITGVVVARLGLKSLWGKTALVALTIPIAMFTNAFRIVTLWMLSVHVDMGFMHGDLHRRGGAAFSVVSLSILCCAMLALRRTERAARRPASP